jgi:simple sugar transport system substrate-binding protein/basic membrane protein A
MAIAACQRQVEHRLLEKIIMNTQRATLPRLLAVCAATASLFVAVGEAPAADKLKAAMLLPGSYNDQSWNAAGYSGLMKIKAIGFDTAVSENVPDSDDASAMEDYASHGYNVVLAHSGRFLTAAQRVGPEFPKTQFIIGGGAEGQAPNVVSIDYENAQFGCQLGYLAARMSKTGKVGGVYGLEGLANIVAQAGGFRICAKKANPAIQVTIVYVKDMEDAASSKEAALSLIADGADVLTGKLNAAQNGLIQAAKEKGVFVTGRDPSSVETAPKQVLTNVLEFWDEMYSKTAVNAQQGKLVSGFVRYGYGTADQTVGATLAYDKSSKFNPAVPAAVVAEVEGLGAKFASGEMKIAPTPDDAKGGH